MKLIELLVQELPKRGGWPDGVEEMLQGISRTIYGDDISEETTLLYLEVLADDYIDATVTREQYEAALAAAQQPVWNGDGLPPVGTECECHLAEGLIQSIVVGYDFGEKAVVMRNLSSGKYFSVQSCADFIKPIRSDADKKRDKIAQIIMDIFYTLDDDNNYLRGEGVYDAIAAGKVPGVKLDV